MACHLFSTKALSEPMLIYYELDTQEHAWVKYVSRYKMCNQETAFKMLSVKLRSFFLEPIMEVLFTYENSRMILLRLFKGYY